LGDLFWPLLKGPYLKGKQNKLPNPAKLRQERSRTSHLP
jgi:hypothetical protein